LKSTARVTGGEGRSDPLAMHPDTIQFTVIRGDGDWRVLRDGRDSGQFDFSVEVFVQDAAGQLRQVDPVGGEVLH